MISKNRLKQIKGLEQKKKRKESGLFVAEGPKLVNDLLPHFECEYIAATTDWADKKQEALPHLISTCTQVDIVTEEELTRASFLKTPQQVLAVLKQPTYDYDRAVASLGSNLCLALDDVQDPGNLGTIIRLADWFGIEDIFCSQGCADVYNPKTVQATMGGLARVRVHYTDLIRLLDDLSTDVPFYGTFLDGEPMYNCNLSAHGLIIMGNEGRGVSEAIAKRVNRRLYIPNYPPMRESTESLNVAIATAIVCAEFRRRSYE